MLYVARWSYDFRERIPRIYPWGECQKYRKLGKARPEEFIGLVYQGAKHLGAKDINALFEVPKILEPYINTNPTTAQEQPDTVISGDVSFPERRSSADLDNMRI